MRLRATVMSHPCGFSGTPFVGQVRSARSKASARASSAERDVSCRRRQQRYQTAVRLPGRTLRGRPGVVGGHLTG